jgi:hypothetical protein
VVLPELIDASEASRDDVRYLCQKLVSIDGASRPSIKFRLAIEQQQRHHHHSTLMMLDQRLPCRWTERHGIKETASPIRDNNLALGSFPKNRVEVDRIGVEAWGAV